MTPAGGTSTSIWRPISTGIAIRVRLTPRSQRDSIDALEETTDGPVLKARVRAIPEGGAANAALERLVADWLGVAKGTVSVMAGGKSRLKTVAVAGDSAGLGRKVSDKLAEMGLSESRSGR